MPVIDTPSPLAAGFNAADSMLGGYNDAKAKALALARQKMLDDRDKARDDRTESHWQTEEGDRQSAATAASKQTELENARNAAKDKIETQAATDAHSIKNEAAYQAKILWPHVKNTAIIAEKAAKGELAQQAAVLAETHARTITAQLDNNLKKRFGPAEAQSIINERNSNIARNQAEARRADAGAGLDEAEAANVRAGRTKTGGNRQGKETYTGDLDKMSPGGQAFAQKLQAAVGDKRLTMGAALNAIAQAKGLSDTDKHLLRSSLGTPEGRMAMTQSDAAQTSGVRYAAAQAAKVQADAAKTAGEYMAALDKNPKWQTVPMETQTIVRQILNSVDPKTNKSITPQKFKAGLQSIVDSKKPDDITGMTPEQAQAMLDVWSP